MLLVMQDTSKLSNLFNSVENGHCVQYRWNNDEKIVRVLDVFDDREEIGHSNCQIITSVEELEEVIYNAQKENMSWKFFV